MKSKDMLIENALFTVVTIDKTNPFLESGKEFLCDVLITQIEDSLIISHRDKSKKIIFSLRLPKELSPEIGSAIIDIGMSGETQQ